MLCTIIHRLFSEHEIEGLFKDLFDIMCDQDDDDDDKQLTTDNNDRQSNAHRHESLSTKEMCRSVLFLANTLPRSTQSRKRLADNVLCFPSTSTSASLINLDNVVPVFTQLEIDQLSCQLKMVRLFFIRMPLFVSFVAYTTTHTANIVVSRRAAESQL